MQKKMEEGAAPYEESATLSAELVEKGIRTLHKILNQERSPPTLFAVLQAAGCKWSPPRHPHRNNCKAESGGECDAGGSKLG